MIDTTWLHILLSDLFLTINIIKHAKTLVDLINLRSEGIILMFKLVSYRFLFSILKAANLILDQ